MRVSCSGTGSQKQRYRNADTEAETQRRDTETWAERDVMMTSKEAHRHRSDMQRYSRDTDMQRYTKAHAVVRLPEREKVKARRRATEKEREHKEIMRGVKEVESVNR